LLRSKDFRRNRNWVTAEINGLQLLKLDDFLWQAAQLVVPEGERLEACELDDFRRQAAQLVDTEVQRLGVFLRGPFDDLQQFVLSHRCPFCYLPRPNTAGQIALNH